MGDVDDDDGVTITTDDADNAHEFRNERVAEGAGVYGGMPHVLRHNLTYGMYILENYGWFLLFGTILVWYLYRKLKPKVRAFTQRLSSTEDALHRDVDEDAANRRQMAMYAARLKQQQETDALSAEQMEIDRIKAEEKRKAAIEDWERHKRGEGYRNRDRDLRNRIDQQPTGSVKTNKPKKPLRDGYNPLAPQPSSRYDMPTRFRRGGGG